MDSTSRLRIAIQKSGRLTDHSLDLLARCGLKYSRGKDQLMCYGDNMPLDLLFVRDDDIPDLVQEDVCDLGIVGLNVIEEKRLELAARGIEARFDLLQRLEFGQCRLALAVPQEMPFAGVASLAGRRIATTYPYLLERYLREQAIEAQIVTLSGSVEIAPRLGRADAICDLVATGSTLVANHLREVATVLDSHAALVRTPVELSPEKADELLLAPGSAGAARRLHAHLPERLARALCEHAGVDGSAPAPALPRAARRALVDAATALVLPITGDRGFAYAEVTAGGVPLTEIRLETMASRVMPGLHLCGEICDVDGRIGGYNFQWAWASGYVAGVSVGR